MLDGVEDVAVAEGRFFGGDLAGVLGETGVLILFVMHEGVEDCESSGMLERFWVLVVMLGGFEGHFHLPC